MDKLNSISTAGSRGCGGDRLGSIEQRLAVLFQLAEQTTSRKECISIINESTKLMEKINDCKTI